VISRYVEALKTEIRLIGSSLTKNRKVTQVHFGGGTPNALPVEMIAQIMASVKETFFLSPRAEIAIECHPALLDEHYLEGLHLAGFNRISLGIQDFDPGVLLTVNRDAPVIPVEELTRIIRSLGNTGVNFDFMYGLPGQTVTSFARTLERAVSISPERLVTFSYAHVPWIKKAQKILEKKGLPDPGSKLDMFLTGYRIMKEAGYLPIGLDHYARPEDELSVALRNKTLHRNFQGYCTRETTGQVYAAGITGISQLESAYIQNTRNMEIYLDQTGKGIFPVEKGYSLSGSEKIIRYVITEIMCNSYLSWDRASRELGLPEEEIKSTLAWDERILVEFAADGLLRYNPVELEITETGRFFVRNIAAAFDPAFQSAANTFSKAI
jgi:oxygen-independent coproporphyrinogen-3 oxidase